MRKIDDRTLTKAQRIKILEKYDHTCVYCFQEATHVDHIIPWSYRRCDDEANLVASCWLCNLVGSNKTFDSFALKQEHIQDKRYSWLKKHPIPLWTLDEIDELGYALKEKVISSCMILNTEEERDYIKDILLKQGFRILS